MMHYLLIWMLGWNLLGTGKPDTIGISVPISRQLIHEQINHAQAEALHALYSTLDTSTARDDAHPTDMQAREARAREALTKEVNDIQLFVESSAYEHRIKYYYLYGLYHVLSLYAYQVQHGELDALLAPVLIKQFREMMQADMQGKSIAGCLDDVPYQVGFINIEAFPNNFGYRVAKTILFRAFAAAHPEQVLSSLQGPYAEFLNEPFTDSIIARVARLYPQRVYDYATSYTAVGNAIRRNPDSLVQTIVRIGQAPYAIQILPFLDGLVHKQYTIQQLEKIIPDKDAYYRLCVQTVIDMRRKWLNDTPVLNLKGMEQNVKRAALHYIRTINDLHDTLDAVRFACVDAFTPQEIYYLLINGEEELYTSSYVGLFKRMMQRMQPPRGDWLLMSVYFDRFKKFITMAAAYNTLNDFLQSMPEANSTALMQQFVSGLEKTETLEDAVDVADAFGSIRDPRLLEFLRREVDKNFLAMQKQQDKRGQVIYALLASLFSSRVHDQQDSVWSRDISRKFHLPPIDKVPFSNLVGDDGRVYEEVLFYGDKDGFQSFNSFMSSFRGSEWKITKNTYWLTIESQRGKPITIFVKLPFADADQDELAMSKLSAYLNAQQIHPTIYIHRGHSYHVNATIAQLQSSARIVILGSCGGYNSLASVLQISPQAQIISSKQTGTLFVNEPIIRALEDQILAGKDIVWEKLWNQLSVELRKTPHYDQFEDYIPPHKNMGAIFIKAYHQLMQDNADRPAADDEP
ncbi:hypothetical protein [Thermoflavifilum thermophilum]|nr:hypothetical protein [Thermoflavifilum thermophilum]